MNKKVCHITTLHPVSDNRIFYKECVTLSEYGMDVSLIACNVPDQQKNGIKIYGIKKYNNIILRLALTSFFLVIVKSLKLKQDIYHFHDPELMFAGFILKIFGKKVVYDVHENNPASILSKPYLKSKLIKKLLSAMMDFFEKLFSNSYNLIITATPDISQRFSKHSPVVLRNLPILPKMGEVVDNDMEKTRFTVIYVGGMSKIRGIMELIIAFENLDADLWLLGSFESEFFKKECQELKGWNKVRYLGIVEPMQIFSYIKNADLGVITFLPYPNHITSVPTKPFEYMACGLPMLMSDFNYWKDYFKESAFYVNPSDSSEIAAKIEKIKLNSEVLIEMGRKNALLATNEFNWEIEKIKLIEAYNKL